MADRIVTPTLGRKSVEDVQALMERAIGLVPATRLMPDAQRAAAALDALAELVGTDRQGVVTALALYQSNLCGAADVLPHVEAEVDRLRGLLRRACDRLDSYVRGAPDPGATAIRQEAGL